MPPTPQVVPQQAPIAYITQHYTHSAHVVPQQHSETPVADALAAAGVNSSALLPSQIQLFRHAQPEQQARLIELWRISPPTYGNQLLPQHLGNWPSTSFEMEEQAAKARRERTEQEKVKNLCAPQGGRDVAEPYIVNGYQNLTYFNGRHMAVQQDGRESTEQALEHDRIMISESGSREWWRRSESQPMEHQYGMQQQMQMQSLQLDDQDEEML